MSVRLKSAALLSGRFRKLCCTTAEAILACDKLQEIDLSITTWRAARREMQMCRVA